jgi:hypothetical protein
MDITASSGREPYHLQFSLQATRPETPEYTTVFSSPFLWNSLIPDARFVVFTAVKIQIEVLWVVTPCDVASIFGVKMDAEWTSETLVF